MCHAVCSLGLETLLGSLCCLEGPTRHVKRRLAFLTIMTCHRLCSGWRRTPAVRMGSPPLVHTWAAWPGLDLSKGAWCLGLARRSLLQFEALSFLVKREEERGLLRPFFTFFPLVKGVNPLKCFHRIRADVEDSHQMPPKGLRLTGNHFICMPAGCTHPSPSEGFVYFLLCLTMA